MVREILKIRTDNGLGDNDPTFYDIEITEYSFKPSRMGMPELTATLMWHVCLDEVWTHKEYVVIRGERFYIRHTPSSSKSNTDARYKHEIDFTSEFAEILGSTYFVDAVPSYSATYDKPCTNNTTFKFFGTIYEFADRLNCAFLYNKIGDSILKTKTSLEFDDEVVGDGYCAIVDPYGDFDHEKTYEFSWEDKKLWEALTEGYNITEIPFERRKRKIILGAVPKVVEHKFEYGHNNELLSINHKNANAQVINRITMLGSSENIPHYYPNETEYGHISLKAKSDNKVLTTEMLSIANMHQLLSRLNADDHAILGSYDVDEAKRKEEEEESGAEDTPVVNISQYQYRIGDEAYKDLPLDEYIYYRKMGMWVSAETAIINIRIRFTANKSTKYNVYEILTKTWLNNHAPIVGDYPNTIQSVVDPILYLSSELEEENPIEDEEASKKDDEHNEANENDSESGETEKTKGKKAGRNRSGALTLGDLITGEEYVFQFTIKVMNGAVGMHFLFGGIGFSAKEDESFIPEPKTGYYWAVGKKKYDGVGSLGVQISKEVTDAMLGDGFGWVASGRMPFQERLMPPKYRNTEAKERFYNALNEPYTEEYALEHPDAYLDPDNLDPETGNPKPYVFPNPYIEGAPSEYIYRDENIKPTIEGIENASGQLFGVIADIAFDNDDNDMLKSDSVEADDKNDSLKYEHSFFYIKLNIFDGPYGFDLFAHYSQDDPMTLQMRSGSCNGCKFKIQVEKYQDETGLELYRNPVITTGPNGEIAAGSYADKVQTDEAQEWQQNTKTHSIWVCVQKDADTFGVIMPNKSNNYKPKIGDKFNIINIVLPDSYILATEKRLEEDGMRFMSDNNEEKFTFDISASRIFFAENPDVLAQLDEYSVIRVVYNGHTYEQYVNKLTIDCKNNEALPNIGIELTDTLSVGQSFVEKVAERASSLIANATTLGGYIGSGSGGGLTARLADKRYINKQSDDRTPYRVSTDTAFEVGEFVSGASGGLFFVDTETGQTFIEVDKLRVRMKAIFEELEVSKATSIGGKQIITPGGSINISFVTELEDSYRCYFKAKEEDKGADCMFVIGDQVQCWENNISAGTLENASNQYYWRLVTAVNNDESYIELSKSDCDDGSDAPQVGDTIVQLGNRNDAERQSAIILSTIDAFSPSITLFNGIDEYSLEDKAVVQYGVDKSKNPPEPFFNCYGRFYFGPKSGNSYLKFEPSVGKLVFSGELINISSINGKDLDEYIKDVVPLDDYDYLRKALLDGATTTNGGLLLSSLIKLGEWDLADSDNPKMTKVWAGHNGLYKNDKTIASFWGGDMVDKFYDEDGNARLSPLATGYAAALVRMDGSAYFAKGNIGFNVDGSGWLGNAVTGIKFTPTGQMTFGNGINIDLGGDNVEGLNSTIKSILNAINGIEYFLVPCNADDEEISWSEATKSEPTGGYKAKSLKARLGLWSPHFISALGKNPNAGEVAPAGASALADLTDVTLTNPLQSGQSLVYDGTNWVNLAIQTGGAGLSEAQLAEYLTQNNYAKTSDIPSLSGYATEDWVNSQGFYKGTVDLSAYATKTWVEQQGYLTEHQSLADYYTKDEVDAIALSGVIDTTAFVKRAGDTMSGNLTAPKFIKTNGTSSQFLKADGSVDSNAYALSTSLSNYIKADGSNGTASGVSALLNKLTEGTAAPVDGDFYISQYAGGGTATTTYHRRPMSALWSYIKGKADGSFVNTSGDTMTGALTLPRINIVGSASSDAYISADSAANAFISVGGSPIMVWNGSEKSVRASLSGNDLYTLGTTAVRWKNVYATTINVSSTDLVANLNADLLDGVQGSEYARNLLNVQIDANSYDSLPGLWGGKLSNATNAPYTYYPFLHFGCNEWFAQFNAYNNVLYFRASGQGVTAPTWRKVAFEDSNVASVTQLANTRTIWGQDFNGTANVSGNMSGVGSISHSAGIVPTTNNAIRLGSNDYNYQGVHSRQLINNIDADMVLWQAKAKRMYFATNGMERMCIDASGKVGILKQNPEHELDVNGTIHANTGIYTEGYVSCLNIKTSSDIRLKDIISDVTLPIDVLVEAPAILFKWKSGAFASQIAVGTTAQYWQKWLSPVVSEKADGYLQMDYGSTAVVGLINLARYTKSEIELTKEEINRLKERIKELEGRLICQ